MKSLLVISHQSSLKVNKFIVHGSRLAVLLFLFTLVSAQPGTGGTTPLYQAPMFKYYIWGQVRSPGAYSLSANPDVVELISAGGGPTTEADLSRVVLIRAISKSRVKINLRKMLNKGEVIPLSPGDVVIVPRSFWYSFRNELTFVSTVAVLVNLTLTIINLTQGGK